MKEYINEIVRLRRIGIDRVRKFLKRNKIFLETFSTIATLLLSGTLAFWGNKLNARNVEINETNAEISKRQLAILENEHMPRFAIERNILPKKIGQGENMEKTPHFSYTITNEGGDVSEVSISPKSYIYFFIPTSVDGEYYIFKCDSHDFADRGAGSVAMIEKDREFSFNDYVLRDSDMSEGEAIARSVKEYFPDMRFKSKYFADIRYIDYMGEEQKKVFEFNDMYIKESRDEEECISLNVWQDYGILGNIPEPEEAAMRIKKEIDNWIEENEGARGVDVPYGTLFDFE